LEHSSKCLVNANSQDLLNTGLYDSRSSHSNCCNYCFFKHRSAYAKKTEDNANLEHSKSNQIKPRKPVLLKN